MNTFPTIPEQKAYWQRKDDEYEAYLAELHRQQQDPVYIASYIQWLDDQEQQRLAL